MHLTPEVDRGSKRVLKKVRELAFLTTGTKTGFVTVCLKFGEPEEDSQ